MREYIDCPDCTAGVNLETGERCQGCGGVGGWWLDIKTEGGFSITWEDHDDQADEPP